MTGIKSTSKPSSLNEFAMAETISLVEPYRLANVTKALMYLFRSLSEGINLWQASFGPDILTQHSRPPDSRFAKK